MLREQMMKIEKESKGMAANYAAEKQRMEVKMREMEQEAKKEREGVEAEHKQQLADLDRRSRDFSPGSCRFFIYFRPAKTTKFYGANQVSSSHPCLE